jgi:hypothetical protein
VNLGPELLLVGAVLAVGVLHTIVPDHWVPIMMVARQEGWSSRETARAAFLAGTGHTLSTLFIGLIAWIAGAVFAAKFGGLVSMVSSLVLIAFGGWIAVSSRLEMRPSGDHAHGRSHAHHGHMHHDPFALHAPHDLHHAHDGGEEPRERYSGGGTALLTRHVHVHRHGTRLIHAHQHEHAPETWHDAGDVRQADPPLHEHAHPRSARTTLLLILGSSPMVEGIPAFFAAAKYGGALIGIMAAVFATATIATYVVLCVTSAAGLARARVSVLERYGEVLSGAIIALVGLVFLIVPVL